MDRMEHARALRAITDKHYNCCQSVLVPFADRLGLTEEQAYALGANFGSGMRHGSTCGALTGALMALGMAYGDENNRQCGKSLEFLKTFEAEFGCLCCRDILSKHEKKLCPALIEFAANYLEDEFK